MINELVVHLGDTKTGSTSIQKALVQGVCRSPGLSICYPARLHHNALSHTLYKKGRLGKRDDQFNAVHAAFGESSADYGVVSAEHFQSVDPKVLDQAIRHYWPDLADTMRLVAYVRPHAEKLLSAFSERLKLGVRVISLDGFFDTLSESGELDYAPRFERWRDVFGNRFHLRPFVRSHLHQGDIVHDFFHYLLGGRPFEIVGEVHANASLTVPQLALLREVHGVLDQTLPLGRGPRLKGAQLALGRIVAEHVQAAGLGRDGARLGLPTDLARRIQARYAADAEALDTGFFDGFPMSEALERAESGTIETAQSLQADQYFPQDCVTGVRAFAQVLVRLLAADPEGFRKSVETVRADTVFDSQ